MDRQQDETTTIIVVNSKGEPQVLIPVKKWMDWINDFSDDMPKIRSRIMYAVMPENAVITFLRPAKGEKREAT